ncbi:MAG: ABC transporter substrate-binding protein [Actinomycetota bacterium]
MTIGLVVLALLAAACGGTSDDGADTSSSAAEATAGSASTDSPGDDSASSTADETGDGAFPVTIEHVRGTTVIPAEPQRVVAYGQSDHSFALALGVTPIALRKEFDAQTFRALPWAEALLGDAEVELLAAAEPSLERIAALQPDVILAVSQVLTEREYEVLSQIAPVVQRTSGDISTVFPWRDSTRLIGEALGRSAEAEQVIAGLEAEFDRFQTDNPDVVGRSVTLVSITLQGGVFTWIDEDIRYEVLRELGFVRPADLPGAATVGTSVNIGRENLDQLEGDVVVWSSEPPSLVGELPGREVALPAAAERREILLDPILAGALFEASPISIAYAIERLEPGFVLALDGDPETFAPSAANLYRDLSAGPSDAEADAMEAWRRVMDPSVPVEDKRPHLAETDELIDVFAQSVTAAEAVGGVEIQPTSAAISDTTALVTFDAVVAGAPVPDLTATVDLVDGVWRARRDEVCSYAALIGVTCP